MKLGWTLLLVFIWLYRSAYSVLGQVYISRLTTLGDSSQFQRGLVRDVGEVDVADVAGIRTASTVATEIVGRTFHTLLNGNPILINIAFQSIGFIGIAVFLMALRGQARLLAAAVLIFPSFTLWSSIASKEAIVVFAVGIIAAYIVRMYRGEPRSVVLFIGCLLISLVYKNQYLPAILFIVVGTWLCARVRQSDFLVLAGLLISFGLLYLFRDQFAELAYSILPHFQQGNTIDFGRLTRAPFWQSPADVFPSAPYGMFLSLFGPTPAEAAVGLLQRMAFVESTVLIIFLVVVLLWRLPRIPIYALVMSVGALFWILIANYPLGVMNAGSAIRYRTGYEMLIVLVVVFIFSRKTYVEWSRTTTNRRKVEPEPSASRPAAAQSTVSLDHGSV